MMGGLRSVLDIGMALLAIANLYSHLSTMASKAAGVAKTLVGRILSFLYRSTGFRLVGQLSNPTIRVRTLKALMMTFVRLFSALLLCLTAKMKS